MKIVELIERECCQDRDLVSEIYEIPPGGHLRQTAVLRRCIHCGALYQQRERGPNPTGGPRESDWVRLPTTPHVQPVSESDSGA